MSSVLTLVICSNLAAYKARNDHIKRKINGIKQGRPVYPQGNFPHMEMDLCGGTLTLSSLEAVPGDA